MRVCFLGRGPIAEACRPLLSDDEVVYESSERITEPVDCDYLLSVMYPFILPADIISAQPSYNLHNAKLPDYKGWNAITYEILQDKKEHTTTIHRMSEGCDEGGICFEQTTPIQADDTALSLYERTIPAAVDVFAKLLFCLRRGKLPQEREHSGGQWYDRDLSAVKDVTHPFYPERIDRYARALHFPPHEPAFVRHEGRKVYLIPGGTE